MVGILFVVAPRVVAKNRVHLEQAEQKNQAEPQFERGDRVQHVIPVVKVVDLLQPEGFGDRQIVALVGEDAFGNRTGSGVVVIGGADEVAGVAFLEQL